ncbi:PREDICTED: uncharacterized protein LOC107161631 isoform X1 [Diuraphis noxia]|uniref:uncharacterized protein LOC107161631 isoform X1 n=1 Tax=Diuraphis noxia TaxID=143948 RepID=UPI0007635826|nr:PREDICTED: uncharacterized protein LOC107161631 isoform X1 [Diuraphis noxia]XP_015363604.1 PREDICTED: uncharacterized protein LOC107161631 isoform X1 [Diuraphis noxia]XP_015363605.1 PREDICTED: uncharacterized protein LOC107161631 isoform X1 [Diuraphis noxia]
MAVKGLTLLVVAFAFCNSAVKGSSDCTLPWLVEKNPFIAKVESLSINRCPTPIIGDPTKEYCCYNTDGKVECCNFQEYLLFGLIFLIPILIVLLILSSILSCICCLLCPCCAIYKRRQSGRVLVQPLSTNCVIIDGIPSVISSHGSYYASASTGGSTPLIPNEYPKLYK